MMTLNLGKTLSTTRRTKILLAIVVPVIFLILFAPFYQVVKASSLLDSQEGFSGANEIGDTFGEKTNGPTDIRVLVASIIKVILGLLGIIFLVLLVLAGYKWMTSSGSEEKIREAQAQIKTAVIGLIIVLAAYGIAVFVVEQARRAVEGY